MQILIRILFCLMALSLLSCNRYWRCLEENCSTGKVKMLSQYCDQYEGEVKNGDPFGYGKLIHGGDKCDSGYTREIPEGTIFEGIWGPNSSGYTRLMGKGMISYPNGFGYGGTFSDDKIQDGPGYVVFPGNKVINGVFKNSYLCSKGDCESGQGTMIYVSAGKTNILEGPFIKRNLVGTGKFIEKFTFYKKDSNVTYTVTSEGKFDDSGFMEGTVSCEKKYEEYCNIAFSNKVKIDQFMKRNTNVKYILN